MPYTFARSAQNLMQERSLPFDLPCESALSLPVAVCMDSVLADAVFLYRECPGHGRPFAWAVLDMNTAEPLLFSRCRVHDFVCTGAFPHDMPLSLDTPQPLSPMQLADAHRELLGLYEILRDFAFTPSPNRDQSEMMVRFARLFEMLAYVGHRPFYRALAPEFLRWLNLELPGGPEPATLPDKTTNGCLSCLGMDESSVAQAIRELSELFLRKIETDAHKQRLFNEMHAELQQYKNNLLDTLTRPMEGDVIKLIDDIEKSMETFRARQFTPDNYRRLLTLFEGVGTDLMDLLYRYGTEPFSQEGDDVVVGRQKVLATLPTDKPKLDKKVAVRHAKGWEKNGKIMRPERVSVYLYTPPGHDQ